MKVIQPQTFIIVLASYNGCIKVEYLPPPPLDFRGIGEEYGDATPDGGPVAANGGATGVAIAGAAIAGAAKGGDSETPGAGGSPTGVAAGGGG